MRKIIQLVLIVSVVAIVLAAPAAAQVYPPPSVGGTTVERGSVNDPGDLGDPGDPGATSSAGGGTLPFTGADTGSLALFAVGVLALGSLLVIGARRRRQVLAGQSVTVPVIGAAPHSSR